MSDHTVFDVHDVSNAGSCGCDEDEKDVPALDVRPIPHAIRHGTVFGALGAIRVGKAMDIIAPHDPKPLLAQIADREQGAIAVEYLHPGPDTWVLRLSRTSNVPDSVQ